MATDKGDTVYRDNLLSLQPCIPVCVTDTWQTNQNRHGKHTGQLHMICFLPCICNLMFENDNLVYMHALHDLSILHPLGVWHIIASAVKPTACMATDVIKNRL